MVAMVDRDDPYHARCAATLTRIPDDGFVTSWPCLTEAMYLLGRRLGVAGQEHLWDLVADDSISVHAPGTGDWQRMRALMSRYKDAPMDLADASLVAVAEDRNLRQVFTFDRHFRAYRLRDRDVFDIVE